MKLSRWKYIKILIYGRTGCSNYMQSKPKVIWSGLLEYTVIDWELENVKHAESPLSHISQDVSKRFSGACIMWDVAVITVGSVGNICVFLSSLTSIDWDKIDVHRATNKKPTGYPQPVSHIWKRQLILNSID